MGLFSNTKKEEKDALLRQIKSEIRIFLVSNKIPRQDLEITSIELETKSENQYKLTIKLCNLGKLIGQKGETIKNLSNCLSSLFDKKFFIDAVESDLWK